MKFYMYKILVYRYIKYMFNMYTVGVRSDFMNEDM